MSRLEELRKQREEIDKEIIKLETENFNSEKQKIYRCVNKTCFIPIEDTIDGVNGIKISIDVYSVGNKLEFNKANINIKNNRNN